MKFQINEETLKATTRCMKGFSCLEGDRSDLCRVTQSVIGDVIFIECHEPYCTYKLDYGNSKICTCPTRRQIYNKYNK